MNETLFTIFGASVTGYGLGAAVAAALVLLLTGILASPKGVHAETLLRFGVLAILLTLICSRCLYVLGDLTTLQTPAQMVRFWDGGYSMVGAIVGYMLAAILTQKLWKISDWKLADAAAAALPLGILCLRICENGTRLGGGKNLAFESASVLLEVDAGEGFLPQAWILEAIVAGVLLIALIMLHQRSHPAGDTLLCFLSLFGCSQVVLESLRSDAHMTVHFVPVQQVVALIFALIALAVWTAQASKTCSRKELLCIWLLVVVCAGVAIVGEFQMDRSDNKLFGYAAMLICLIIICVASFRVRRKANSERI